MDRNQIHYEVFARRTPQAPWRLELATEDRAHAIEAAEETLAEGRAAAVRVTKEILDPETMEFRSVTLLSKGAPDTRKRLPVRDATAEPACVSPADLYTSHAREKVARLLEDWLRRYRVTPFELLHRPDLVERLEASGMELQHAIQKVAVPESQNTGHPVHDIMRVYQKLVERTIERVIRAGRKKLFPNLEREPMAEAARRLGGDPERLFLMGGAVALALKDCITWREKVDRLLEMAENAPADPNPRALCLLVIEQPLTEILATKAGLAELLGADADLGASLAALTRLAAPVEVEALIRMEPGLSRFIPALEGPAARLGRFMTGGEFKLLAGAVARRVVNELNGPRRLRPSDPEGEIGILRALAMALTASAGRLLSLDEVQGVFSERSRSIVTSDFVDLYLRDRASAMAEAEALVRLCENVAGGVNKRHAARWLSASVSSVRFEMEMRSGPDSAAVRLHALASLQRAVRRAALFETDGKQVLDKVGEIGGLVEADARLCAQLAKAPAPPVQKLTLLLKLAAGEAAPVGPAADRARAEVMKLLKAPEVRAEIAAAPEIAGKLREVMAA